MPRQVDHDERRTQIILGVWQLMASGGIEAVTMRRVAAAAGVSVGRIQHYFEGRGDLVRASARVMLEGAEGIYEQVTHPDEALRFAIRHVVPTTEQQRVGTAIWLSYVAASVGDPEMAAILVEGKRGQEDEVVRLLTARGDRDEEARRVSARGLLATADGLAVRVLIGDLTATEALTTLDEEIEGLLSARP